MESLKILLRLVRISDNKGRSESNVRDLILNRPDQFPCCFVRDSSPHRLEDGVRGVLQRNVEIPADVWVRCHRSENFPRKSRRIGVHQADPFNAGHAAERLKKLMELPLPVKIQSPVGRVLTDEDQFLD